MQLLLIRHAIAEDRDAFALTGTSDAERPLTEFGRRRMQKNARGLRSLVPKIDILATSPMVRARETAEIVRAACGAGSLAVTDELLPDRHPREFETWLGSTPDDAVVAAVGHEPQLSRLVHWLLAGQAESHVVLKKGGACLLDFNGAAAAGEGALIWMVTPWLLRAIVA